MSFTPEQLQLLQISDQVEDQLDARERQLQHAARSKAKRIARIGIEAWRRIRHEALLRYKAKRLANQTTTKDTA
jgi:hypothetical protein